MSFDAMAWASKQSPKNSTAKLCLLIMSSMANQDGILWPSHQHLADQCLCTRRTIINTLKSLEAEGYISKQRQFKDNAKTSNLYTVNVDRCETISHGVVKPFHMGSETISHGGSETISHKTVTLSKQSMKQSNTAQNEFERWWKVYPKKVGKKKCQAAWKRRHKELTPITDKLITDVQARLKSDDRWVRRYIPDPLTYLNGDRWEDEIQGASQGDGWQDELAKLSQKVNQAAEEKMRSVK